MDSHRSGCTKGVLSGNRLKNLGVFRVPVLEEGLRKPAPVELGLEVDPRNELVGEARQDLAEVGVGGGFRNQEMELLVQMGGCGGGVGGDRA